MIRTVGGSCDCGDPSSWDPAGFCPEHCETPARLDSPQALELLPKGTDRILAAAQRLIPKIVEEVDRGLKAGHGDEVIKILELLQRLGDSWRPNKLVS
eukprot:g3256.t1